MSDRVGWARPRSRQVTVFDPEQVDGGAIREMMRTHGLGILLAAPQGSLDVMQVRIAVRPARFVSHGPMGRLVRHPELLFMRGVA